MIPGRFGRFDQSGRPEQLAQGNHKAQGVVLRRKEGFRRSQELLLFLKGMGTIWINAPGADGSKNRFGGGTEPLMWGTFDLYQSPKRLYLKGVDVREDFRPIRKSSAALLTAVGWCGHIASRLPAGMENDTLLSLLWGSMRHLASGLPPLLLDVRFAWRWGNIWGTAPSLVQCFCCGREIDGMSASEVRRTSDGLLCGECFPAVRDESRGDATFYSPLTAALLQEVRYAAMLPRERFAAWVSGHVERYPKALKDCSNWLYSFL